MTEDITKHEALKFHEKAHGKVQTIPTVNIRNVRQLALAYVPGSVAACGEIHRDQTRVYDYTGKSNRLAEVGNGGAMMGMGSVGPAAALPLLEGKCLLLKLLGDVNAVPMAINAAAPEEITAFCGMIAPSVGGINIEGVGNSDVFQIIDELTDTLDIPVFCDDQQGNAAVILSAVKNSLRLLDMGIAEARIVVAGTGVSGTASALLLKAGALDVIVLNEHGILGPSNKEMDPVQSAIALRTNPREVTGGLNEALAGADILIGMSGGNTISRDHIKLMNKKPVVLALSLPDPEICHADADEAGAFIYASSNVEDSNALLSIHAFPGIVRVSFDVRAKKLTDSMLFAAAEALSNMVDRRSLAPDHICPRFFGSEATPRIAEAVGQAAINDGVAYLPVPEGDIYKETWQRLFGDIEHI